jgi:5-methylcytosine-specific restriction enzyme A
MGGYTHYWGPDGFSGMKPGQALEYASSSVFSERGVGSGDVLYIVTVARGQLTLLGRFPVSKVVSDRAQAASLLGRDPWGGAEHAFALPGTGSPFDPARRVSVEVVRKLRFETVDGVRALKFKDDSRLDQQTLRGVRQLTPDSATLLDSLLSDTRGTSAQAEKRAQITMEQVEAAYESAVRVHDGLEGIEAAARGLRDQHGLNVNSARDFLNDYRLMLSGRLFQRAMSAPAMEYFLSRIWQDRGEEALTTALEAVDKHVEYYEGISKTTLHRMRKVVDGFKGRLRRQPVDIREHEETFGNSVRQSMRDSATARRQRLQRAGRTPVKATAVVQVFVRNPDVVAEVLSRSAGQCERCKRPAPFKRRSDGTPYLEVHHRQQLASGGEDTVENALALCPNCHRELHFGPL